MRYASKKRYGRARTTQRSHGPAVALSPAQSYRILTVQLETARETGLNVTLYELKLHELLTDHPEVAA